MSDGTRLTRTVLPATWSRSRSGSHAATYHRRASATGWSGTTESASQRPYSTVAPAAWATAASSDASRAPALARLAGDDDRGAPPVDADSHRLRSACTSGSRPARSSTPRPRPAGNGTSSEPRSGSRDVAAGERIGEALQLVVARGRAHEPASVPQQLAHHVVRQDLAGSGLPLQAGGLHDRCAVPVPGSPGTASPTDSPTRIWICTRRSAWLSRCTDGCMRSRRSQASATECSNTTMRPSPRFFTSLAAGVGHPPVAGWPCTATPSSSFALVADATQDVRNRPGRSTNRIDTTVAVPPMGAEPTRYN